MTGRLPYAPAFDHLVYLRVFEGCNLHCEHCFIPSNPKRMTMDDLKAVPEKVAGVKRGKAKQSDKVDDESIVVARLQNK